MHSDDDIVLLAKIDGYLPFCLKTGYLTLPPPFRHIARHLPQKSANMKALSY